MIIYYKKIKPKSKKIIIIKNQSFVMKKNSFFQMYKGNLLYAHIWQNQWNNLHIQYKSLIIQKLVKKFFLIHGLYINKFYLRINHNNLKILSTSLGVFKPYKTQHFVKHYRKKLKDSGRLNKLAEFVLEINKLSYIRLDFNIAYLPIKFVAPNAKKVFIRDRKERFFWESLQLVYAVFKGYASSNILGSLVYTHTRRNPNRLAFVAYIKRLLDWHFNTMKDSQIQGVRLEVKGRFNAKSRSKKHILSSGRVRMHEKSSIVDSAFLESYTKFGSLGIKVWVCPK